MRYRKYTTALWFPSSFASLNGSKPQDGQDIVVGSFYYVHLYWLILLSFQFRSSHHIIYLLFFFSSWHQRLKYFNRKKQPFIVRILNKLLLLFWCKVRLVWRWLFVVRAATSLSYRLRFKWVYLFRTLREKRANNVWLISGRKKKSDGVDDDKTDKPSKTKSSMNMKLRDRHKRKTKQDEKQNNTLTLLSGTGAQRAGYTGSL